MGEEGNVERERVEGDVRGEEGVYDHHHHNLRMEVGP